MPFAVSDAVSTTLHAALNGISHRQRVIADNIANVDTPGFRATSVDFESSLRQAIADGELTTSDRVASAEAPTSTPVGANGNNVDLRKESVAAIQTQFSYQIVGRAVGDHLGLLRTAAAIQ